MNRSGHRLVRGITAMLVAAACGGAAADEPGQPRQQQLLLQQQARQQARQMEQILQPALHAELELIRTACGDLEPEAKRAIKAAAVAAVRTAAERFAAQQQRPGRRSLDLPAIFSTQLDPVIERHVAAEGAARWRRERDARDERRAETTRLLIVGKLDEELELTSRQRESILADLKSQWNDAWLEELADLNGPMLNGRRPAPDYAAACITPHLDERQQQAWTDWVRIASWRQMGVNHGWRFPDGPGLQGPDPWWDK